MGRFAFAVLKCQGKLYLLLICLVMQTTFVIYHVYENLHMIQCMSQKTLKWADMSTYREQNYWELQPILQICCGLL